MTALAISIPEPLPFDHLLSFKGKCAVVTVGSRALGEAIVRRLAAAGAAVVSAGGRASGIQADLASLSDSQKVIDHGMEQFVRVDILVNNASVFPPCMFLEVSEEVWDQTVDTNLKGAYFLAQFAVHAMISAGRGGRIINLLSTDAFRPTGTLSAYGAAKLDLWSATQAMAKELAEYQILVNAVTPGSIIGEERIAKLNDGTFGDSDVPEGAVKTR